MCVFGPRVMHTRYFDSFRHLTIWHAKKLVGNRSAPTAAGSCRQQIDWGRQLTPGRAHRSIGNCVRIRVSLPAPTILSYPFFWMSGLPRLHRDRFPRYSRLPLASARQILSSNYSLVLGHAKPVRVLLIEHREPSGFLLCKRPPGRVERGGNVAIIAHELDPAAAS